MPPLRRMTRARAGWVVATGLAVALVAPGGGVARAEVAAPESGGARWPVAAAPTEWSIPDRSVDTDPTALIDAPPPGVAAARPTRVVGVFARGAGIDLRPVVRTWDEPTPAAAAERIKRAQAVDGLISIGTEVKQQFLTDLDTAAITDPRAGEQWALSRLRAEEVWPTSRGAGVTVAVVDTGVGQHPDLQGEVTAGVDYATGGSGRNDGNGHGTHVAGIIAATPDNGIGIAGFAPDVRIMPVRVLDDSGSGYTSNVSRGIIWAVDNGADIISLSLGGGFDSGLGRAVSYAQSLGALVVAAAGNERTGGSPASYPAAFPDVIAVAATDRLDGIAYFSTAGSYVDIAAPGVAVLSTIPGGYESWSGTSMATPYVSAVAAVVLSAARSAGQEVDLATSLLATADDLGAAGRDDDFGVGLVDPVGALETIGGAALPAPTSVDALALSARAVRVTWAPPTEATEVRGYRATAEPGGRTCVVDAPTATCDIAGLSPETTYSVTVRSLGLGQPSPASPGVDVTTLPRQDRGGDTRESATGLVDVETFDLIDAPDDIDWWRVDVAGSGDLRVVLGNLPADYDLRVYDASGGLIGSSLNAGTLSDSVNVEIPAGSTYIKIEGWLGVFDAAVDYSLVADFTADAPPPDPEPEPEPDPDPKPLPEPNPDADEGGNSLAEATPLGERAGVSDAIDVAGDADYWEFTVAELSRVRVSLDDLPVDATLSVLTPEGIVLGRSARADRTAEQVALWLVPGTYVVYVRAVGDQWSPAPYTLLITRTAHQRSVLDVAGNSIATAGRMPTNGIANDVIHNRTDRDYWTFRVRQSTRYDIVLLRPADYALRVLRTDGRLVAAGRANGTDAEIVSVRLAPGRYVLRVAGRAGAWSTSDYSVVFVGPRP